MRRFPRAKLLVIGDVIMDQYLWGKVTRISPEAPVPIVNVQKETLTLGGAGNVVHNIFSIGAKVSLAGLVGNDKLGKDLTKMLQKKKVDIQGLLPGKDKATMLKTRVVAHNQQVVRVDREKDSVPQAADLKKIYRYIKKVIPHVDAVIVEDYGKGLITQELITIVATMCKKYNKVVVVDPKKDRILDFSGVTAVTPNLEEALLLAGRVYDGEYDAREVEEAGCSLIDKWQLQGLLVTLGEHGMSLFQKAKSVVTIPSMVREVYDVSGAGDTVVAVFTAALVSGATMLEAAYLANLAAGIVVAKVGTAVVTNKELLQAIKNRRV